MAHSDYSRRRKGDFNFLVAIGGVGDIDEDTNAVWGTLFTTQGHLHGVTSSKMRACLTEPPSLPSIKHPLHGGAGDHGSATILLSDKDGYFTDLFASGKEQAVGRLTTDVTAAAGTFTIVDGPNATFQGGPQYVHIGSETILCSGYVAATGVFTVFAPAYRGFLGTEAAAHKSAHEVTNHIVNWYNRSVTIYGVYADEVGAGGLIGDYYVLFRGVIREIDMDDRGMSWRINAASMIALLDTDVATEVAKDGDDTSEGGITKLKGDLQAFLSGGDAAQIYLESDEGLTSGSWIRVDDEAIYITNASDPRKARERGSFRTVEETHDEGADVWEIFPADTEHSSIWVPGASLSTFWREDSTGTDVQTDHPLAIFLNILMASGTGSYVYGGATAGDNGRYDYLPKWAGLNINEDLIDVLGIEDLMFGDLAGARMPGYIWLWDHKPTNVLSTLSKELLEPIGCVVAVSGGKLTVIKPSQPLPGEDSTTIDNTMWSQRNRPRYTQGVSNTLNRAVLKHDYYWGTERFARIEIVQDWPTVSKVPNAGKILEFEIKAATSGSDQAVIVTRLKRQVRAYVPPPAIIEISLPYAFHDVNPGDIIKYSDSITPNPKTGTRGYDEALMQVVSVSPDPRSNRIGLVMIFRAGGKAGRVGAAAQLNGVPAGAVFTVEANEFTSTEGTAVVDADAFDATDRVILLHGMSAASNLRLTVKDATVKTVSTVAGNDITLNSAWGGEADEDVIVHAPWDGSQTEHMEETVYFADADEGIGAVPDPPYHYRFTL